MTFKITRQGLGELIAEELASSRSVLLESPPQMGSSPVNQPVMNSMGPGDASKSAVGAGTGSRQLLYHMSQQAQQLHDMMTDNEELSHECCSRIKQAAKALEVTFKIITYDKGPGMGLGDT
jgi:hypothetical protein|tara:strand:+ start:663 stop:1025 length:363 start_codon:yes stop_codon:yes gene_type:complete